MFLDPRSRIQQSGWGQYNGSIELMVWWNEGPCGFDGSLKLKNSRRNSDHVDPKIRYDFSKASLDICGLE